jgi:hypothetical protein
MDFKEILEVVSKINSKQKPRIDEKFLSEVLALVVKNPLDDDRARCQEQIAKLLADRIGEGS